MSVLQLGFVISTSCIRRFFWLFAFGRFLQKKRALISSESQIKTAKKASLILCILYKSAAVEAVVKADCSKILFTLCSNDPRATSVLHRLYYYYVIASKHNFTVAAMMHPLDIADLLTMNSSSINIKSFELHILPHRQIKYPVDFDDELKTRKRQIR